MKKTVLIFTGLLLAWPVWGGDCTVVKAYHPKWAKNFTLEYGRGYTILSIKRAWQSATVSQRYLIDHHCGKIPPAYAQLERIDEDPKKVVALSTTYLPFFQILGLEDRLVGTVAKRWVNARWAKKRIATGKTKPFGPEITDHLEELLLLEPDLVMSFGLSDQILSSKQKLHQLGLVMLISAAHRETSPLGRAEWILAFSAIFGLEAKAVLHMRTISNSYLALKRKVALSDFRPTVFVGSEYKGVWYVPGGQSYQAHLIADAGGDYLWRKTPQTGSLPLDFEVLLSQASGAQFWLNAGRRTDLKGLSSAKFQAFKAIREKRVFNYTKQLNSEGGNDYWETGSAYPNRVLQDLVAILHPELLGNPPLYWYQRLQ